MSTTSRCSLTEYLAWPERLVRSRGSILFQEAQGIFTKLSSRHTPTLAGRCVSVPPLPFGASNIYFQGVGCTPPSNYCLAVGSVTSYSTISEVPLGAIGEL